MKKLTHSVGGGGAVGDMQMYVMNISIALY